ncbi:MAG: Decarboxylase NovR [Alphaproteobacteria bacterium MarineAlpha3_Bin5]|nr:aldolase [Magnetovibrio sp.]PPR77524.1 MAG: Decarboxylase NovR [Alphaproteobacteria bacterium MarineAlpha3_Bin5]
MTDRERQKGNTHKSIKHFENQATAEMNRHLADVPAWTVCQKLALTARMLATEGHGSALAGQITARGEKDGTMWTAKFGLGLDEICASDFLLVDDDLNVHSGDGMANPSNRFHLWIYRARSDVECVVHTHPPYVSALSMINVPLVVSHMDTAMFYDDCAWLQEWPGPPIGDEEGELISRALGDKHSILLAHHGQLSAGESIEQAAVLAFHFERAAKMQLEAMAAGKINPLPAAAGKRAHDYRLKTAPLNATFYYYARKALKASPELLY